MEKKEVERDQWGSRFGFILAAIGSAVGLGNIWRFPYMAYENGGGAFLIPYFFALLTAGIPLLILEMGLGHKMRGSAPLAFRKVKEKYETMGWWTVIITALVTIYYSVIIAWGISFMFFAINGSWGTDTSAFFHNEFLQMTNFWDLGGIRINILVGLFLVWGLNYSILVGGIKKGIEKASKVFMPILALLVILITIRGVTLDGAIVGVNKFLEPNFSVLKDYRVWVSAYGQVFFTLSLGFGIMIAYASYLPKKSDITNNAFITAFANSGFSFMIGLGIFGVLGNMAVSQGVPLDQVVDSGIGLAFIAFPKAINLLPGYSGIFGFLFFLCFVLAGLSSTMSLIEAFSSSIIDKFKMSRTKAITLVCGCGFLISTVYATGMGLVILDVVDHFINNFGLVVVGVLECIIVGYFFNVAELKDHINQVSDFNIAGWWDIAIKFVTPIVLGYTIIMNFFNDVISIYGGYSADAVGMLGWGTIVSTLIVAVLFKNQSWNEDVMVESSIIEEEI